MSASSSSRRYALYWTPEPEHPLWAAGCRWLARDPGDPRFQAPVRAHTESPRRYGFHATLKAPLVLRQGAHEADFLDLVQALAHRHEVFDMPPLQVSSLGGFVALRPSVALAQQHALRRLADDAVRTLDPLRAPLSTEDLQRRLLSGSLSAEQLGLLQSHGYPHVFEHWRFHMTLSNSLNASAEEEALRQRLLSEACDFFAEALQVPLRCESVCVFTESRAGAPFQLLQRFALPAA